MSLIVQFFLSFFSLQLFKSEAMNTVISKLSSLYANTVHYYLIPTEVSNHGNSIRKWKSIRAEKV